MIDDVLVKPMSNECDIIPFVGTKSNKLNCDFCGSLPEKGKSIESKDSHVICFDCIKECNNLLNPKTDEVA